MKKVFAIAIAAVLLIAVSVLPAFASVDSPGATKANYVIHIIDNDGGHAVKEYKTDVDEGGIQPGHDLAHLAQIDVSDGKTTLTLLFIELDQDLILGLGNGDFRLCYVNNQFTVHIIESLGVATKQRLRP